MMKKLFGIILIAALIVACGDSENKDKKENAKAKTEVVADLSFDNFVDTAGDYINKEIKLVGSVVHVCKHSGKKMFIVGTDPDIRLKITAGDKISKFPMELLGSDIEVQGVLIDLSSEVEKKITEVNNETTENKVDPVTGEACETETALAEQSALATYVLEYNNHEVK